MDGLCNTEVEGTNNTLKLETRILLTAPRLTLWYLLRDCQKYQILITSLTMP